MQGCGDGGDGISDGVKKKKWSVEGRSAGFDLQGLGQTGGCVWKQTHSSREIPIALQTTFHPSVFKEEQK